MMETAGESKEPTLVPKRKSTCNAAAFHFGGSSTTNKCGVCGTSVYSNDAQFAWDNVKYHKVTHAECEGGSRARAASAHT